MVSSSSFISLHLHLGVYTSIFFSIFLFLLSVSTPGSASPSASTSVLYDYSHQNQRGEVFGKTELFYRGRIGTQHRSLYNYKKKKCNESPKKIKNINVHTERKRQTILSLFGKEKENYFKHLHLNQYNNIIKKNNNLNGYNNLPFFLLRPQKSFSFCHLSSRSYFQRGYSYRRDYYSRNQQQQETMIKLRASSIDEWEREKRSDERDYFKIESESKTMNFGIHDQVQVQLDHHPSELMKYMAKNPERIIYAAWEEDLIQESKANDKNFTLKQKKNNLEDEVINVKGYYRILTPKVKFIRWEFQPCLDMVVYTDDKNHLVLQSQSWEVGNKQTIAGVDQDLIKAFDIEIKCKLYVDGYENGEKNIQSTDLRGDMLFFMSGKLPLVLRLTPNIIIRKAATLVNNTIMSYAKRRFMDNIVADFEGWKKEQVQ